MRTIGIIAEYNPFHNGHAYQIETIRKQTNADFIVVAMSGDFVQRGEPSIIDKYTRAKMALCSGADLVIELPVLWATSSAEHFAKAGVTLFNKMGCIDTLCFGAETDNFSLLSTIADILTTEPDSYRTALSSYLKEGLNFPLARAKALCHEINISDNSLANVLSSPNNILAIEYLKALKCSPSSIKPFLLKREGANYHDTQIYEKNREHKVSSALQAPIASATAIRNILLPDYSVSTVSFTAEETNKLMESMPAPSYQILKDYLSCHPLISVNDFSAALGHLLLSYHIDDLLCIGDITPELANRFYGNRDSYYSYTQFCELNNSKNVTYSRLSRILLHLLLHLTTDMYTLGQQLDYIPYLRILGFKKDNAKILSILKKSSAVPIISKLADAKKLLSDDALKLLEKDIFAANLYEQTKAIKKRTTSRSEYTREIVLI